MNGPHTDEGHEEGVGEGDEAVQDLTHHQGRHVQAQAGGEHHEDGRVDDGPRHEEDGEEHDERRDDPDEVFGHPDGEPAAPAEDDGDEVWLLVAVTVTVVLAVLLWRRSGGSWSLVWSDPE